MGRFPTFANRITVTGAVALLAGSMMIIGVGVQTLTAPAFADTSAFELFCTNTPIGDIAFNGVVMSGALSPAAPSPGQQFNLTNFQTQLTVPSDIVQEATAVGNTAISGTATVSVTATGATPSSMPTAPLAYNQTIPNPVPPTGITLTVPSTPATIGPFTATSANIALSLGSSISLTFNDIAFPGGFPPLVCSAYPNDVMPSGLAQGIPPGLPIAPVIASAGTSPPPTTTPAGAVTGAYELYCPHTPVGDLIFNDVTTTATISPGTLAAGDQFQVTGYQTDIPIPAGAVTAAAGLGNGSFVGLATSTVDAYGTTASQAPTGSMGFDVPIPAPVPSTGVALDIPSAPTTIGPLTAVGGPVTIAQDQSVLVVAKLSSKAFKMSCTAYPNDSIATSGSTGTPPLATPIRPIIATAAASGAPIATTTTTFQPGGPGSEGQTPGAPYELYCSNTPVGDIALNDVVTTGSITPTSLNDGDQFQVANLQTQFTIPQSVAQQAENLGLTTLSGDLSLFLDVTGTQYTSYDGSTGVAFSSDPTPTTVASSEPGGTAVVVPGPYPVPYPFPGEDDLSFNVTLPSPVPSTGVQFTATEAAGSPQESFLAAGGPIQVLVSGANLDVTAFGDQFGLFCDTLTNNSVPTGLSIQEPYNDLTEPLITTGSATIVPTPPGAPGSYELYCPGTPVGNIVLNNTDTVGTITPPDPAPGQQFNITGYQTTVTLPSSITSAAAALGNSDLAGTATASVDASGATPPQISTGTMNFDVPIPSPVPNTGVTLSIPSSPGTIGPFTATASGITIAQDARVQLDLIVSGSDLELTCAAYPNDSEPTGIVPSGPAGQSSSPVIAVSGGGAPGGPSTPTLTVSPSDIVSGGDSVSVTGSGLTADSLGNVLECNNAPNQPTVDLGSPINSAVAVGCTPPSLSQVVPTSTTGTLSSTYTIVQGTVGPPCGAAPAAVACPLTDSSGESPENDAADYPCPPTPAQADAGVTCVLTYGDEAGDDAIAPILFPGTQPPTPVSASSSTTTTTPDPVTPAPSNTDPAAAPTSTSVATSPSTTADPDPTSSSTPTSAAPTTTSAAATNASSSKDDPTTAAPASTGTPVVHAASGSLAFTGSGAPTGWVVLAGVALVVLGLALLALVDAPRRLRWALGRNAGSD